MSGMLLKVKCERASILAFLYMLRTEEKITKAAKYKDCDVVGKWTKSITNHMYWCAASSPDGDDDEMVKRWKSLMDHLCNDHNSCYADHTDLEEMANTRYACTI